MTLLPPEPVMVSGVAVPPPQFPAFVSVSICLAGYFHSPSRVAGQALAVTYSEPRGRNDDRHRELTSRIG